MEEKQTTGSTQGEKRRGMLLSKKHKNQRRGRERAQKASKAGCFLKKGRNWAKKKKDGTRAPRANLTGKKQLYQATREGKKGRF